MQEPTNELQFAFNLSRNDYYRGLLILQLSRLSNFRHFTPIQSPRAATVLLS